MRQCCYYETISSRSRGGVSCSAKVQAVFAAACTFVFGVSVEDWLASLRKSWVLSMSSNFPNQLQRNRVITTAQKIAEHQSKQANQARTETPKLRHLVANNICHHVAAHRYYFGNTVTTLPHAQGTDIP